jgi:hypothetical protein
MEKAMKTVLASGRPGFRFRAGDVAAAAIYSDSGKRRTVFRPHPPAILRETMPDPMEPARHGTILAPIF